MAMTKKTITVFTGDTPNPEGDFANTRAAFVKTMYDSGKTDSLKVQNLADNTFQRNWLDQAAADEWVTFYNNLTNEYNFVQTTTIENM